MLLTVGALAFQANFALGHERIKCIRRALQPFAFWPEVAVVEVIQVDVVPPEILQ